MFFPTHHINGEVVDNNYFLRTLTHHINGLVVDNNYFLWTVEAKRKFKINFKTKNFLVMYLDDKQLLYVYNWKSAKEICDTLEMIYGVSQLSNKREWKHEEKKMNVLFTSAYLDLEC